MKNFFTLLLFVCISFLVKAQDIQVAGRITSAADGKAVAGAAVLVKGTQIAVTSDVNGDYKILCAKNAKLVFSFVGMKTIEMDVAGLPMLNVVMEEDRLKINEVVITALGVKKEKKQLGYSVQDVRGDELNQAANFNPIGALSGKVAGLNITNSSGDPGAATYILLRGQTSLGLGNQPLFVVDGVPIDNSNTSVGNPDNGTNNDLEETGTTNRALDINPADIENVSVLKGPAASALYGSQAANGVILITTKKGKMVKGEGKRKINLQYSSSLTFDRINSLPALQNKYSQGYNGKYIGPEGDTSANGYPNKYSWGAPISDLSWNGNSNYQYDKHGNIVYNNNPGAKTPVTPYDNAGNFFQTGRAMNHAVSFDGGNENSSYRVSISNVNQKGIVPTTSMNKTNISLNTDFNLTDKVSSGFVVNYSNMENHRAQMGSNTSGLMLGLLRTPITFDNSNGVSDPVNDPTSYQFDEVTQRNYRGGAGYDNPYWTINRNKYTAFTNHAMGNFHISYKPYQWLDITDRVGSDYYNTTSHLGLGIKSSTAPAGRVSDANESSNIVNNDLMATATKQLNDDLNLTALLGWNLYSNKSNYDYVQGDNLTYQDFFSITNASSILARKSNGSLRTSAYYTDLKFGYRTFLFLDMTGRYEQSSTFLPVSLGNFFYPSASLSYIFTENIKWFKDNKKILSFGKVRFSLASVGKYPTIFSTLNYYGSQGSVLDGWTTGEPLPYGGQLGFAYGGLTNLLANPNLKPEVTNSREFGIDLRFLEGRINLDYTYYKSFSKDLLLAIPIAPSSGYRYYYTNAASMWSEGHEVVLSILPVKTKSFQWETYFNYARNVTFVSELAKGIDQVTLNGFTDVNIVAAAGYRYGQIAATDWLRDANGHVIISDNPNDAKGYPVVNVKQTFVGNINPKWSGGWGNTFTFRNIKIANKNIGNIMIGFLFDTKQGQKIWDGTRGVLNTFGMSQETANRSNDSNYTFNSGAYAGAVYGHLKDGAIYHYDANGNEVKGAGAANTSKVALNQDWYTGNGGGFGPVGAQFVEDASFIKLREVSIAYTLPAHWMSKTKFFKGVTIGFVGRNLWLHTKFQGGDPETSLTGASDAQGIHYFNNPGTKTWGFNLKVNF